MLVLTRKLGEFLVLNDNIFISVFEGGNGDQVKIAIEAPEDVKIARSEMLAGGHPLQENRQADQKDPQRDGAVGYPPGGGPRSQPVSPREGPATNLFSSLSAAVRAAAGRA